jgi:hypothetical protein
MAPYLTQILTAAQRGKQIARTFGADGTAWDPIVAQTEGEMHLAQAILDAE